MKKRWKASVIVVAVALNSLLVYCYAPGVKQFVGEAAESPDRTHSSAKSKKSELSINAASPDVHRPANAHSLPDTAIQPSPRKKAFAELTLSGSRCLDKLEGNKTKQIYTWTDASGVRHISDSPRKFDTYTPVTIAGEIAPDSIAINFLGHKGHPQLRQAIKARVNRSKIFYEKVLPASLLKPITINFRLLDNEADYKRYLLRVAPESLTSQGVYISGLNESVIWIRNDEQAVRTAVHEAMHGMNRHWVGQMGKWLNEGLAELAEDFSEKPSEANLLLPFTVLLNASQKDWNNNPHLHYASAKAYVSRIYNKDKADLARLLLAESENGCSEMNYKEISEMLSYTLCGAPPGCGTFIKLNLSLAAGTVL